MGAGNGARPREPEASGLSVVVATDGRSPHLFDVVTAAAHDPAVDDVNVVAKRVCPFSELLQDRNWHEPS